MQRGTCRYEDCESPIRYLDVCSRHYYREYKAANRDRLRERERARRAKVSKPCVIDECSQLAHAADGHCDSHKWRRRVQSAPPCSVDGCGKPAVSRGKCQPHYRRDHITSEQKWRYALASFGVTPEWYNGQLEQQGGVCAICRKTCRVRPRLGIDHDHQCCVEAAVSCGKCTRGLLCNSCNVGLGMLSDDPQLLRVAAEYVEGWRVRKQEAD